jgi:hypothetical protein
MRMNSFPSCKQPQAFSFLVLLAVSLLVPATAFGQTDVWLGGAGSWSNGSKWSAGVPTSSANVLIDNGNGAASPVTIDFNGAQSGNLTIDSDDSLTIVDPSIFTVFGPTIANAGTFSNECDQWRNPGHQRVRDPEGERRVDPVEQCQQQHHGIRTAR